MSDRLDDLDYYTLLGASPEDDVTAIKRAFRAFARRYHPDQHAGKSADTRERAAQIYRRGSEAYQTLLDPLARTAYDANLKAGKLRLTADERERAAAEARAAAAPKKKAPAIRSPQARAFYERAAEEARRGQWREAWKLLKQATATEPGNALIESRLQQVEGRIRRGGR